MKIYIDGQEGTTGLKIVERFKDRQDIELLTINPDLRKDPLERKKLINESDITFLCLPDTAAIEAVSFVENNHTKIIDASTAHRTNADWAYGLPELSNEAFDKIRNGNRIAVPGCFASGFLCIVKPLLDNGLIDKTYPLTCYALTGYSGGGKKMIAEYEDPNRSFVYDAPRQYGFTQSHKHLKEMVYVSGISSAPCFGPIVADFYSGMQVSVPFALSTLKGVTKEQIHAVLKKHYAGKTMINVASLEESAEVEKLAANEMRELDTMTIYVFGNEERVVVTALYDNLGKGASGAAVQCMNIMLGLPEDFGLNVK